MMAATIGLWSVKTVKALPSKKYLKCLMARKMPRSSLSNRA